MNPTLELKEINVLVKGRKILHNIALQVNSGEIVVILGSSGAGKSTLLKSVVGMIEPSSGSIEIDGENITHKPPNKRCCAMVADSAGLFEDMTVRENIYLTTTRKSRRNELTDLALTSLDITHLARRLPLELSAGESQKVALARALIRRPRVLLFDEPLAHVDPASREQLITELLTLHSRLGCATLYVTHDIWEAYSVADRICYLKEGRIIQDDLVEEVHDYPATAGIAKHLGATNFLAVTADVYENECGENMAKCSPYGQNMEVLCGPSVETGQGQKLLLTGYPRSVFIDGIGEGPISGDLGQIIGFTYQGEQYLMRIETELGTISTWVNASHNQLLVGERVRFRLDPEQIRALPIPRE